MIPKTRSKKLLITLLAMLLLAIFAFSVFAASDNVEKVLAMLNQLEKTDVNPDWQPDIRANQNYIQGMLNAYTDCTASERKEFTAQQNKGMRAYFEALYQLQGKDVAEVDAVFEGKAASGSSSAVSSSSVSSSAASSSLSSSSVSQSAADSAVSSSAAPSSQSANLPKSVSASPSEAEEADSQDSGVASIPIAAAPVSRSDSSKELMPAAQNPPQMPKDEGFWSNAGLGQSLLLVIVILLALLLIRFFFALRSAWRSMGKREKEAVILGKELYGEEYLPDAEELAKAQENGDEELSEEAKLSRREKKQIRADEKQERKEQRREEKKRKKALKKGLPVYDEEEMEKETDPFSSKPLYPFQDPLEGGETQTSKKVVSEVDQDPLEALAENREKQTISRETDGDVELEPASSVLKRQRSPSSNGKRKEEQARSLNQDARITGRPKRMPFNQGAADDLDAIDD